MKDIIVCVNRTVDSYWKDNCLLEVVSDNSFEMQNSTTNVFQIILWEFQNSKISWISLDNCLFFLGFAFWFVFFAGKKTRLILDKLPQEF